MKGSCKVMINSNLYCCCCYGGPTKTYSQGFKRKIVCKGINVNLIAYLPNFMERNLYNYETGHGYIHFEGPHEWFVCSLVCLQKYLSFTGGSILNLAEYMNDYDKMGILEQYRMEAITYNSTCHRHLPITLEDQMEASVESDEIEEDPETVLLLEIKEMKEKLLSQEETMKEIKDLYLHLRSENKRLTEENTKEKTEHKKVLEKLKEKDREIFKMTTRIMELEFKLKA